MDLFENHDKSIKKNVLGKSKIEYIQSASILTEGKGFMDAYDFTLNPYTGCTFGCNYCYAAFFSRSEEEKNNWGYWLKVKENALALLIKKRRKPLIDKTIYISSVTDPYQPIEKELELTRKLLKELIDFHRVRLVIQTRSPLVTRDIDLFLQFDIVQVNMTITTDSEEVRKAFEPLCPSNKTRLKAIKEVNDSGVNSCITMTPLLPIQDANSFIESLLETGVKKFVVQPFHPDKGKFVASTREEAVKLTNTFNWDEKKYKEIVGLFKNKLPFIGEGKSGFAPI
ncbi:MAG: radical SAM protein [Spirosomataceae bacterium]|jgi:DNA repair photolyase